MIYSSDTGDVNYLTQVCSCKKWLFAGVQKTRSTACLNVGAIGNV